MEEDIYICPCCKKTYVGSAKCPTCDESLEEACFCEVCGEPILEDDYGVCENCVEDYMTTSEMSEFSGWLDSFYNVDEEIVKSCWRYAFSEDEINDILEEAFKMLPIDKQNEIIKKYIKENIYMFKGYIIEKEVK